LENDFQWKDPEEGYQLEPDMVRVASEYQHEKLELCGIEPELYRGAVDPSFFIGIAIHAGVNSGISAEGAVNMLQSLEMLRAPRLDEPLLVQGEIKTVETVARGQRVETHVWFSDQEDEVVLRANRISLRPSKNSSKSRGAGDRPLPVITNIASLEQKSSFQLTPEIVCGYSSEGNSIHYDERAAKAGGFRAPIIGGGMGVHYLMADLWAAKQPARFKCNVYFRRPIFWDDSVSVRADESYRALGLLKEVATASGSETKIGTEMEVVYCD
jgi:hypothetical protein